MLSGIFEMFTQLDQTLDRAHGGLGIGLRLVKSLVEMHEGSVVARSRGAGQGSEFTVRLPATLIAKEVSREFEALFEESMKQPQERHTSGSGRSHLSR